jgi:uncharacterized protein YdiU (UPF0061 family)
VYHTRQEIPLSVNAVIIMHLHPPSYLDLPALFFERVLPTPVVQPSFVVLNRPLAGELGCRFEDLESPEILTVLSGGRSPHGSIPLALAYAGHQFGQFVPVLGDGRAVLLGEVVAIDGASFDVQLKGSGQTPFSRRGDGRAALGPMLREYIIGEALHALGIPATRTLAVVSTGEVVMRERPLPGGIQVRIAQSHVRIGTFQFAAMHGDRESLSALADYVIRRHYQAIGGQEDRWYQLARSIIERQAALIAQWMCVGFIHGVMNTDNVAVSGESIDFGPCAWMNRYDPATVFSSIDRGGRYAFGAQPRIIQWNSARLVEALVPLLDRERERAIALAQGLVDEVPGIYAEYWLRGMRAKIGLKSVEEGDASLISDLLEIMRQARLDYTGTFRSLSDDEGNIRSPALASWMIRWRERTRSERNGRAFWETLADMRQINPAVIARNHLVEEALRKGAEEGDFSLMTRLVAAVRDPFTEDAEFGAVPAGDDPDYRTFCGT